MSDLISRQAVLDLIVASVNQFGGWYTTDMMNMWGLFTQVIKDMPSAEPETHEKRTETHSCDLISRQAAIMHFVKASKSYECGMFNLKELTHELWQLPSAQPEITECPMCPDCPDGCPLEVEHETD